MNTKTKIINALDAFERKYIKGDFIYMLLAVVAIIGIFHTVTREVEVIDTVQAKEVKEVVETQKVGLEWKEGSENLNKTIKWGYRYQPINAYKERVEEMYNRGYSLTRMLDIMMVRNMECDKYNGDCFYRNGKPSGDTGYFQINIHAHRLDALKSWEYWENDDWGGLYLQQLTFANRFIGELERDYCGWKYTNSNEVRAKCVARNYNGNVNIDRNGKQRRDNYKALAWEKRLIIAEWIKENTNLYELNK